jgi:hypothetical protein
VKNVAESWANQLWNKYVRVGDREDGGILIPAHSFSSLHFRKDPIKVKNLLLLAQSPCKQLCLESTFSQWYILTHGRWLAAIWAGFIRVLWKELV